MGCSEISGQPFFMVLLFMHKMKFYKNILSKQLRVKEL